MKTGLRSLLSGLVVTLLLCPRKTVAQRPSASCQSRGFFRCDNGRCINEDSVCNDVNNCGDNSDEEQGCTGIEGPVLALAITIPTLCTCICSCGVVGFIICMNRCLHQSAARTCVFETTLNTGASTVVVPNRTRTVTTPTSVAALSSTQQPATDTHSNQEAPPPYDTASSFPSILQDGYQYQSNLTAADPGQESRVTVQDRDPPTYSSIAPNANQNCRHLTLLSPQTNGISLAIQQPDGLTLAVPQPDSITQDPPEPDGITHDEEAPQPDGLTWDTPQPDGLPQDTPYNIA